MLESAHCLVPPTIKQHTKMTLDTTVHYKVEYGGGFYPLNTSALNGVGTIFAILQLQCTIRLANPDHSMYNPDPL